MQTYTKILIGMAVGVALGFLVGPNSSLLPQTGAALTAQAQVVAEPGGEQLVPAATNLREAKIVGERAAAVGEPAWLELRWKLGPRAVLKLEQAGVRLSEKVGSEYRGFVRDTPAEVSRYAPLGRKLISYTQWIGQLFLALIKMVVVPLVFLSLVVGVASLGDFRKLGRMGGRTLGYFTLTTMFALVIGVGLANLLKPGALLSDADRSQLLASYSGSVGETVSRAAEAPSLGDQIVAIVPVNPVSALAGGDMLQIIFFAVMLGVALTMLEQSRAQPVVDVFSRLNDAMVMLVHMAMAVAPYGVAALLFKVVGTTGLSVLLALGVYAAVVVLGLATHVMLTYGTVVRLGTGLPWWRFLAAIKEPLLVAFSTSSSSATLPVTMEACEDNLGCSRQVTSFVLPLGATVNMDGTALYQGVAAVFIAQIYGMDLSLGDQATVVLSATLASVGAAGVPGAGMITLAMVLTAVGVPTEGLALILGADRILDMFRTATNVVGDATATALIGRLEGDPLRIVSTAEDKADPDHGFESRLHSPKAVPVDEG